MQNYKNEIRNNSEEWLPLCENKGDMTRKRNTYIASFSYVYF